MPQIEDVGEDMRKFKITVIGTINRDTIIFPRGNKTESFGGILYNLVSLSVLGGSLVEIYPVCHLGYDAYDQVMEILKKYKNVKLDGIKRVETKNNHACLLVDERNQREEILYHRVPPLSLTQSQPFLDSDAVLVNFISGFDLSLNTLKRIREKTDAPIFMDVHSLTLGVNRDGTRFYRAPKSWEEYLSQADFVQTNLTELTALSQKDLGSLKKVKEFGEYVLSLGPKALLITLGDKGALLVHKEGRNCRVKKSAGIKVEDFKDAVGCGDVFSSGFLICYLLTAELERCVDFANRVAAEKCKTSGVKGVALLLKKFCGRCLDDLKEQNLAS